MNLTNTQLFWIFLILLPIFEFKNLIYKRYLVREFKYFYDERKELYTIWDPKPILENEFTLKNAISELKSIPRNDTKIIKLKNESESILYKISTDFNGIKNNYILKYPANFVDLNEVPVMADFEKFDEIKNIYKNEVEIIEEIIKKCKISSNKGSYCNSMISNYEIININNFKLILLKYFDYSLYDLNKSIIKLDLFQIYLIYDYLINAKNFLFNNNIFHRDYIPKNILIKDDNNGSFEILLIDYDTSILYENTKIDLKKYYFKIFQGTSDFLPPYLNYINKYNNLYKFLVYLDNFAFSMTILLLIKKDNFYYKKKNMLLLPNTDKQFLDKLLNEIKYIKKKINSHKNLLKKEDILYSDMYKTISSGFSIPIFFDKNKLEKTLSN